MDMDYMEKLERLLFGLLNSFEDLLHDLNLDQWEHEFHQRKIDDLKEIAIDLS